MDRIARRGYSDADTTTFPKMGDEPLTSHLVNASGDRSPYTQAVPRHGPTGGQDPASAAHRSGYEITEAHGPTFRPMATVYYPNAPEATATMRNVKIVPSAVGDRDFWAGRQQGPVIG